MENPEKFNRFSSCRGVAFEIKPHSDPFAIPAPPDNPTRSSGSRRSWVPFGSLTRVFPSSELIQRSISRTSSHFCDLDNEQEEEEDDEDVETLADIEEGHEDDKAKLSPQPLLLLQQAAASKKQHQNPKNKPTTRLSVILLDQGLFTVYKRLFLVCIALNVTGVVLAAAGRFPYARARPALFSIANIFALVLCRSEAFLRVAFWLAVAALGRAWVPLRMKTAATSLLQSLGGIHSGCGVSSIIWLVYALVLTLRDRESTSPGIIAAASAILGLLCLCSLAWVFVTLKISYDPLTKSYPNKIGSSLVRSQELWFTVGITVLIIIPWLTVRKVKVQVSSPSGHAAIIKFAGGVKAGILGRISPSPLSEWHAFGIISDDKKEHMMLAGAVGDFTKSLVSSPPTHLWVRQVHFAGLPYLTNMYNRVLLVATGSGICVFLSFLLQPCAAEWMSGPGKGKVIVHDTAVLGRPNVSEMSVEAAKDFAAEVVIVTSNPEGSRDVVNACKAAGFAAFGPIWDS
ncbi:hypothetical protein PHJA_001809800 [Phtheirospermum japonicum]|uniref:Uncharacterized protein n=1 Tax=Phtheirospermum japonicum TaxID=374723 RepID=A0A830C7G3_9LAMI|nr:hypothetical protein PHJA_001809800 [Phtheirospermum japonicum]